MAAIDEVDLGGVSKTIVAAMLWQWLDKCRFHKAFTVKFWFVKKDFTFEDLFPVFEMILGARVE
jgi:hypothetical protein